MRAICDPLTSLVMILLLLQPMKWNKLWLAIAFNAFATLIGFGFGYVFCPLFHSYLHHCLSGQ
jgi:hypothetical protein